MATTHRTPRRAVRALPLLLALAVAGPVVTAGGGSGGTVASWPPTCGAFARAAEPRRVGPEQIFEYMDGAGELYLAYRFDHLESAEYRAEGGETLLAEVYLMGSGDDAYGLASQDWGGEPVDLGGSGCRGLYGAGLLRGWCGSRYVRVLASRETAGSRESSLQLAAALLAGQQAEPPPALVAALPDRLAGRTRRPGSAVFLRSDLVLNSVYYISADNILSLDKGTAAVVASYAPPTPATSGAAPVVVLAISYRSPQAASRALSRFVDAYLPGQPEAESPAGGVLTARVEDGWLGVARADQVAVLAFRCPSAEVAEQVGAEALRAVRGQEVQHD